MKIIFEKFTGQIMKKLALFIFLLTSCQSIKINHFTLTDQSFEVDITKYEPLSKCEKQKSIIIMPPTGGTNLIDRSYAKMFAKNCFNAYIINFWTLKEFDINDMKMHDYFYRTGLKSIQMLVNHIGEEKIDLLGTSVGALHTSIAIGKIYQIKKAFTIVGGGDIASIIVQSSQKAMMKLKKERYQTYQFKDDQEYIKKLSSFIPYKPLELNIQNKKLGMVISVNDPVVPSSLQLELADYWQPKVLIKSKSGHRATVIKTWLFHSKKILNFFL